MADDAFRVKLDEAKSAENMRGQWWQLVYNEQCAPAAQWFSQRGWTAAATTLTDYLESVGRATPATAADVVQMIDSITLVSAVKN